MARRWRALPGAFVVLAAACLGACGAGAGIPVLRRPPPGHRRLRSRVLVRDDAPEVRGADTVMRLLQRNAKVTTRYGGGFVQSIDGVAGGRRGGRPVDWFFYVNGIESDPGAASVRVRAGDRIWWDHHDWGGAGARPGRRRLVPGAVRVGAAARVHPVRVRLRARTTRHAPSRARARASGPSRRRPSAAATSLACSSGRLAAIGDTPVGRLLSEGPRGQRRLRAPGPRRAGHRAARRRAATASAHAGARRRARRRDAHGGQSRRSGSSPAPTTAGVAGRGGRADAEDASHGDSPSRSRARTPDRRCRSEAP